MSLALTVLEIVAPVFILGAIGYAWVRIGVEYRLSFVTQIAMSISLPCLIFTSLMQADLDPRSIADLGLASLVAYGALIVILFVILKMMCLEISTFLSPLVFGNTGNLGLPLALFAFGEAGLSYAVVVFAVMAILSFTFGIWIVSGGGLSLRFLREPLVWAALLGAVFLWQDWQTPQFLTNTLELIGQIAIPLMLITLGVTVARLEATQLRVAIILSVIKIIICCAIAWLSAQAFALEPKAAAVLILQIATPVAVTSYLLAEKYGKQAAPVAGLVVTSTVLSIIILPVLLSVLLRF